MRHYLVRLSQNDKRWKAYILRLWWQPRYFLAYNGKTDLCVSDTISIFELLQSEYNRIQQYIDNGVQKVQVWVLGLDLVVAGDEAIRSIHLC